jgi:hypothetical protein
MGLLKKQTLYLNVEIVVNFLFIFGGGLDAVAWGWECICLQDEQKQSIQKAHD